MQGVGDLYTGNQLENREKEEKINKNKKKDPQMHTINGIGFGKGNLGPRGFEKFIETHRCNG